MGSILGAAGFRFRVDLRVRIALWVTDFLLGGLLSAATWIAVTDCPRSIAEARRRRAEYRQRLLAREFVTPGDALGMTLIGAWLAAFVAAGITVGMVVFLTRVARNGS